MFLLIFPFLVLSCIIVYMIWYPVVRWVFQQTSYRDYSFSEWTLLSCMIFDHTRQRILKDCTGSFQKQRLPFKCRVKDFLYDHYIAENSRVYVKISYVTQGNVYTIWFDTEYNPMIRFPMYTYEEIKQNKQTEIIMSSHGKDYVELAGPCQDFYQGIGYNAKSLFSEAELDSVMMYTMDGAYPLRHLLHSNTETST